MSATPVMCTLLVPGFGLVTCVTETTQSTRGDARFTVLRSAVDDQRRRVDPHVWTRVERILCAR